MNAPKNGRDSNHNDGGPLVHQPVLYHEVLNALEPKSGQFYLDGTLGAGGHAEGIIKLSAPHGRLLGLDLDPAALTIARQRLHAHKERLIIRQSSFHQAPKILDEIGWHAVHGILLDLGVSSMQIDHPERGFSFMANGPLDMRFNQEMTVRAADLVNFLSETELASIIWKYGEERHARRIARAIIAARPLDSTHTLAKVITGAVPGYAAKIHPATRTFQALRIATNKELETISAALPGLINCLAPNGKIAVISFHSLEDRIVKQVFRRESKDCLCPPRQPICTCDHTATVNVLTKKPLRPSSQEVDRNPRSRSAKLRIAEKL